MSRLKNLLGLVTRPRPQVGLTPCDVVFRENKWSLLRYQPRPEGRKFATPVLGLGKNLTVPANPFCT